VVVLDASGRRSVLDFYQALRLAIGAPECHGSSTDAFIDPLIMHDDINALKAPHTTRIARTAEIASDVTADLEGFADAINRAGACDRGTDLEVTIEIAP
jgi:hypothetical protein